MVYRSPTSLLNVAVVYSAATALAIGLAVISFVVCERDKGDDDKDLLRENYSVSVSYCPQVLVHNLYVIFTQPKLEPPVSAPSALA